MTFDNAQLSHTHLVTYPSLWLPPHHALRCMLINFDQLMVDELVSDIHAQDNPPSIVLYHVPQHEDITHADVLNWILINSSHSHMAIVNARTLQHVAVAGQLATPQQYWLPPPLTSWASLWWRQTQVERSHHAVLREFLKQESKLS